MFGRPILRRILTLLWLTVLLLSPGALASEQWPTNLRAVIENTQPLKWQRNGRLPLFVLPISGSLSTLSDELAMDALVQLDRRGIGYSTDWNHNDFEKSLAEGIRIGRMQEQLGQPVTVNANACLYSFCDGSDETLHIDARGRRFAETSFGGRLGCPFAIEHRIPVIKQRVEQFLRGYQDAGVRIGLGDRRTDRMERRLGDL